MKLQDFVNYLNELLQSDSVNDYAPNGLQVEGKQEVRTVITGVSACRELFEKAIEKKADTIVVHHGLFWKSTPQIITGNQKQRLKLLFDHDISLLAYHLPLDLHPELGNNAGLFRELGLEHRVDFGTYGNRKLGFMGSLPAPTRFQELLDTVRSRINPDARWFGDGPETIRRIAVVSGGAADCLHEAIEEGVDVFLTGEDVEWAYHLARETKIRFIAAGHHATERFGPRLLSQHLRGLSGIEVSFEDVLNPI